VALRESGGRLVAQRNGRALDPLIARSLLEAGNEDREPPRSDEKALRPYAQMPLG
jgi:hypothetical protein